MTTLKLLEWDNCFSYGAGNVLKLDQDKVTQIIGLNGYGKTSIPLILEEGLFNKNAKNVKKSDIANRVINDGYNIHIVWETDGDEYEIFVNRKTSIKVKLLKNGEDISSHTATNTYKTVENILGVDYKVFTQLVLQNNRSSVEFLTATDTNRKKFLIDLLHLEEYVKLHEVFKSASKEINSSVTSIQGKIDTIEKWLNNNKLTDTTILPMLKLEINMEKDEQEYSRLSTEIEIFSEKNKKILKNNQFKKLLNEVNLQEAKNIAVDKKESYDKEQLELGRYTSAKKTSENEINNILKLGAVCPTCAQEVDEEFKNTLLLKHNRIIEDAKKKIGELNERITEIKRNNKLFDTKVETQRNWEELYRSIDQSLPTDLLDEGELKASLAKVRAKLLQARELVAETARTNEERTKHNTRIQIIQEQTETFEKELAELLEVFEQNKTLLSEIEVLKKAFSTNGLVAYKIENLVKELEDLTNLYLAELSDGQFTIEFVVINDKLTIQITDNGVSIDINNLSSGELAKVSTSTLLAIRKLMSSISKSRINILFLDEIINTLDQYSREKLIEILLNEEGLNTYLVSHGWTHPLLEKIEVVKEDKISRILDP